MDIGLQQKLKLQQKLSPQQLQVIRMLEYPTIELEERIHEEMEQNPALDEGHDDTNDAENSDSFENESEERNEDDTNDLGDGIDLSTYDAEDDIPDYKLRTHNHSADDEERVMPLSSQQTFSENLLEQLKMLKLERKIRGLATYIIGNIDDDGYLRREPESMVDDLAFQYGIEASDEEMEEALTAVQSLEPAGVAARNLQECLLIQCRRQESKTAETCVAILENYFEQFSQKKYDFIAHKLNLSADDMKTAVAEILKCNPRPGSAYATNSELIQERITPDFVVENDEGQLCVSLNNVNVPELRVSKEYLRMLNEFNGNKANQTRQMKEAITFTRQKIESARWFIEALQQRNNTLLTTMEAIVEHQRDFFLEGDETKMRPLKQKDIAEQTGFDISTVSRVTSNKFVQTDFGVYPLKYFFVETMQMADGQEVSNRAIKKIISELVDAEDATQPVTDDQLAQHLREQGFVIARRTVAKYREQLGIPVARLRRR